MRHDFLKFQIGSGGRYKMLAEHMAHEVFCPLLPTLLETSSELS